LIKLICSFICTLAQKEGCRLYCSFNRPQWQWKNINLCKIIMFQICQDVYIC